jgi:hypothetical protein
MANRSARERRAGYAGDGTAHHKSRRYNRASDGIQMPDTIEITHKDDNESKDRNIDGRYIIDI